MKTKKTLAAFLAAIQLGYSFSFGAYEVLAQQVKVQAVPQGISPTIGAVPVAPAGLMPSANPTLGLSNLSLTPSLQAPAGLPALQTMGQISAAPQARVQAAPNAALQALPQASAQALSQPRVQTAPVLQTPAAASPAQARLAATPAVEGKALTVQAQGASQAARTPAAVQARQAALSDASRNAGAAELGKTQSRVGEALELKGLDARAGAEASKGAAEDVFSALRGEQTLSGSQTAVPAASMLRRVFHLRPAQAAPVQAQRPAVPTPSLSQPASAQSYRSRVLVRVGSALAGAAVLAAAPVLASHAAMVGVVGSLLLGVIGIPQIVKNFQGGREGVKDLAIESSLIWFAAATLLSAVSLGQGASFAWNAVNVLGVAQSATVVAQLNWYKRDAKDLKKSLLTVAATLAPLPFMAMQVFMPMASWVNLAFTAAMGLLWVLNWPQIRKNYQIYKAEGRAPTSVAVMYPALVAVGSLLHLYAALMSGDVRWAMNAIVAIVTSGAVLAQVYFPKVSNAVLGPLVRLTDKLMDLLSRGKGGDAPPSAPGASLDEARKAVAPLFEGTDLRGYKGTDPKADLARIQSMASGLPGRSVVYLEAPTSAGKSTLAKTLEQVLGSRIKVFPVDRYFKDSSMMPRAQDGSRDFDRPESLLLDRAADDVRTLLAGGKVELPVHDMATEKTRFDSGEFLELGPDEVLIVDSIYASHDSMLKAAEGHKTLNIFLYAPASVRLARRLKRDRVERGKSIEANLRQWSNILYDEKNFILPLHEKADVVMNLMTEEELAALPQTYAEILAQELAAEGKADPALTALLQEMIRQSLRADRTQAGGIIGGQDGLPTPPSAAASSGGLLATLKGFLETLAGIFRVPTNGPALQPAR